MSTKNKKNHKIWGFITLALVFLFTESCIDPINFQIEEDNSGQLVIMGIITNQDGPYTVTVNRTSGFFDAVSELANRVNGAVITLTDSEGNVEVLQESSTGIYKTDPGGIKGEIGRYYTLTVQTSDGEFYQSSQELLNPLPEIDCLFYEYEKITRLNEIDAEVDKHQLRFFIETTDPGEQTNYYRWTWNGTYRIRTFPELVTTTNAFGATIPAPLPCSEAPRCVCCDCWVTEENNDLQIIDDEFFDGNKLSKQLVGIQPVNGFIFLSKFHLEVFQYSLSEGAFNFWKLIKDQKESQGTLFETPPAKIPSNLININDPDELVWGYFEASAVESRSFFIQRSEIPQEALIQFDTVRQDCRQFKGSTNQKPPFWD